MKKHPEVRLHNVHICRDFSLLYQRAGHEINGPRAPHKVDCVMCSFFTGRGGLLPQKHFHAITSFPRAGLHDRRNREPELVPRDPRDHAQPCVQRHKA